MLLISLFCVTCASGNTHRGSDTLQKITPIICGLLLGDEGSPQTITPDSFIEQGGLLVVELESLDSPLGWQKKRGDGALGSYLEWEGQNHFNQPGNGLITIRLAVDTPGTYQFAWRSSIREGTSSTDANDSWLRIQADNFYGVRSSQVTPVCPNEQLASNRCSGRVPNGSSKEGWFKVYRSGGVTGDWQWRSFTSDNDAHVILADFDRKGEYLLEISARSKNHAIDRFVLFRSRNIDNNVDESFATDASRPESAIAP